MTKTFKNRDNELEVEYNYHNNDEVSFEIFNDIRESLTIYLDKKQIKELIKHLSTAVVNNP